jgi:hypothetical protein
MRKFLELDSIALAGEIVRASDDTVWDIFALLRRERRLSVFVSEMNASTRNESQRTLALSALRRIGFEYAG